jgi:uncharacterized tellurite resistance protein B-like protein
MKAPQELREPDPLLAEVRLVMELIALEGSQPTRKAVGRALREAEFQCSTARLSALIRRVRESTGT